MFYSWARGSSACFCGKPVRQRLELGRRCLSGGVTCRAIVCEEFGGPEVLQMGEQQLPPLGEGQLLVRMKAAGVNPSDTYMRLGPHGPWAATPHLLPSLPFTPGKDGAGVIEALGPGVDESRFRGSDRVYLTGSVTGTYADLAVVDAATAFPLPHNVTFSQGACVGVPCATAYRALAIRCPAGPGDRVFIHGASGAVGLSAVQLAKARGCDVVVGSAGTAEGVAAVLAAGADVCVDRSTEGYLEEAKTASGGGGFDVCLEMMASSNLAVDLPLMAKHGVVGVIGSRAEPVAPPGLNPRALMATELDVRGVFMPASTGEEVEAIHAALYGLLAGGGVAPVVAREVPLADAAGAHREVASPARGGAAGNVVVTIGG